MKLILGPMMPDLTGPDKNHKTIYEDPDTAYQTLRKKIDATRKSSSLITLA